MRLLSTKNISPKQLSAATALVSALLNTAFSLLLTNSLWTVVAVFIVTFLVTYGVYFYTLQVFIYRKIKVIYKFIFQTKATKKEEFFYNNILPQKSIEEVSRDVARWAAQRRYEIDALKENESFRKEFLMNLAHELRTPIFTAQGYIDTLLGGALADPEVATRFLSNASRSIDRLVRLVDDLNEISKLESGRIGVVESAFVIQDLIREVYEEFSMQAETKPMTLTFKKGTEGPIAVLADRPKIRQVLANLVENALKYGHDGGTVTAGCYSTDGQRVYVEISDDGPGIPETHLPRIFERFYRADKSRNREIGGTGLGLAIVKHLVEAHGQTITVRSKPGVGSSFGFTLREARN
ncbi:MAG: sensor histidine kinase [Sphingobacteriales bacterium]|nr:MAG: sensor histidine kinase [Sphingobacteriales bacterium]